MNKSSKRERLVTWQDPMISAKKALQMSGLDYLQAMVDGHIAQPPVANLTKLTLMKVEQGLAVFQLDPDESLYNPIGSVHGGVIATICDSAASCAVHTLLPAGKAYATLEMKVNYVRPVTFESGRLTCTGKVIHPGRRTGTAEAHLVDEAGKLYAHASVTCLIFAVK